MTLLFGKFGVDPETRPLLRLLEKNVPDFSLTPGIATAIFVLTCLAGHRYRKVWKAEGPVWQLWAFGLCAALGLAILGFVPLRIGQIG
jgi:hypothetical protein